MELHRGLIGQRVVVRRRLPGERGPSGGPALSDVVGVLAAWDDETLSVRRGTGELVSIPLADVTAGKPVPPMPSRRRPHRRLADAIDRLSRPSRTGSAGEAEVAGSRVEPPLVDAVLQELIQELRVTFDEPFMGSFTEHDGEYRVFVSLGREGAGFALPTHGGGVVEAELADRVQDVVIDICWTGWPMCPRPDHAHPMRARSARDAAYWVCPVDECRVRRITAHHPTTG